MLYKDGILDFKRLEPWIYKLLHALLEEGDEAAQQGCVRGGAEIHQRGAISKIPEASAPANERLPVPILKTKLTSTCQI